MHDEGEVCLRGRRENARRGKARVVDEQRVVLARPSDRVRRIRDNRLERLIVPVLRVCQRVPTCDVEVIKIDVVQEHIDAAEVVGGDIDLLPVEAVPHVVFPKDFCKFE